MANEEIVLPLKVPDEFFNEFDRRFEAMAKRAVNVFNQAARSGGGAAGGGGTAGGGGGGSAAGVVGQASASIIAGAGAGIAATPAASASSPAVLAQNAALGAAQAGIGLLRTGAQALGGVAGAALGGPAGAIAGAAAGGLVADFVQAQFNGVKEAMEVPTERGVSRLKAVYGNLSAAGVETSAEEREAAIKFSVAVERKRYEGERGLEKQYREIAARDSTSYGLSWLGR